MPLLVIGGGLKLITRQSIRCILSAISAISEGVVSTVFYWTIGISTIT